MSVEWKTLSREAGLKVTGNEIRVRFGGDRSQTVIVDDSGPDAIRLSSTVVRRSDAARLPNAALETWKMNRYRELVGFKTVEHGRIIGEAWVPRIALAPGEWRLYVLTLARSCDRLEYLWTGRDAE